MPASETNSIGMELIELPAGSFVMGGDWDAEQADENELPQHEVVFKHPFYIGRTPVTQAQWETVMGANSGTQVFHATARLRLPGGGSEQALREALEAVAADLVVDVTLAAGE